MSCEGRFHLFYRKRDIVNNPAEATGCGKVVCEWNGQAVKINIKNEGKKPSKNLAFSCFMQPIPFSLWTPNPPPLPHKKTNNTSTLCEHFCQYLWILQRATLKIERLRAKTIPWFFGHFWKCSEVVVNYFWTLSKMAEKSRDRFCSEPFNYVSSSHSGFAYKEYNTKSLKQWAF